jgi:internalin A
MSKAIAIERISNWEFGEQLILSNLGLTEIPKEIATCTNLKRLFLGKNKIHDVSPLTSLTNLTDLYLNENKIQDVSPLASLTQLKYVILFENKITDVTQLASLTNCTVYY